MPPIPAIDYFVLLAQEYSCEPKDRGPIPIWVHDEGRQADRQTDRQTDIPGKLVFKQGALEKSTTKDDLDHQGVNSAEFTESRRPVRWVGYAQTGTVLHASRRLLEG